MASRLCGSEILEFRGEIPDKFLEMLNLLDLCGGILVTLEFNFAIPREVENCISSCAPCTESCGEGLPWNFGGRNRERGIFKNLGCGCLQKLLGLGAKGFDVGFLCHDEFYFQIKRRKKRGGRFLSSSPEKPRELDQEEIVYGINPDFAFPGSCRWWVPGPAARESRYQHHRRNPYPGCSTQP